MSQFKVYKDTDTNKLIVIGKNTVLLETFDADCGCDYIANMIRINEEKNLGLDREWLELKRHIEEGGL